MRGLLRVLPLASTFGSAPEGAAGLPTAIDGEMHATTRLKVAIGSDTNSVVSRSTATATPMRL